MEGDEQGKGKEDRCFVERRTQKRGYAVKELVIVPIDCGSTGAGRGKSNKKVTLRLSVKGGGA